MDGFQRQLVYGILQVLSFFGMCSFIESRFLILSGEWLILGEAVA